MESDKCFFFFFSNEYREIRGIGLALKNAIIIFNNDTLYVSQLIIDFYFTEFTPLTFYFSESHFHFCQEF